MMRPIALPHPGHDAARSTTIFFSLLFFERLTCGEVASLSLSGDADRLAGEVIVLYDKLGVLRASLVVRYGVDILPKRKLLASRVDIDDWASD